MTATEKDYGPGKMMSESMQVAVNLQGKIITARKKLAALRRDAETCSVSAGELPVKIMEIEEVLK